MLSQCNTEVVASFSHVFHPATCCHPRCRIGEVDQEDLLSGVTGGVIVDKMLGLLLSFQRFTVNKHHAGREMPAVLHESKTNRP